MNVSPLRSLRRSWPPVAVAVALAMAGCAPPTADFETARSQPLQVEMTTYAMAVAIPDPGVALNSKAEKQLQQFARLYLRRGRGLLHVATTPGDDPAAALAQADNVRNRLVDQGIRSGDIVVAAGQSPAGGRNAVVLSFKGYQVQLNECGDWSGNSGFNPTNLPHINFGCAFRRNIGLMLSDPGDLVEPVPPGTIDAQRMDSAVQGYRAGSSEGGAVSE